MRVEHYILRFLLTLIVCVVSLTVSAQRKVERGAQGQMVVVMDTVATIDVVEDTIAKDTMAVAVLPPVLTPEDSLALAALEKPIKQKRDWNKWRPDPKRALWLGLVIPGAGQIYNRKFWKLPIVYGGIIGCAYAMRWNNQMYLDYSQAYLDLMDDDPATRSYDAFLHLGAKVDASNEAYYKTLFKNRKDRYRRWRDLSFFVMLGVYALSVIDAYVDAHLAQFDISDDLSLHLEPAVIGGNIKTVNSAAMSSTNIISTNAVGIRGALTF